MWPLKWCVAALVWFCIIMSSGCIGVNLAGILGGRMARAKGGSVLSGVGYGERCPLSSRLEGLGERRDLPQRGPGQSLGQKWILAYFEGHRMLFFVLMWQNLRGTISISVLYSKFWGTCPPWSTPMSGWDLSHRSVCEVECWMACCFPVKHICEWLMVVLYLMSLALTISC